MPRLAKIWVSDISSGSNIRCAAFHHKNIDKQLISKFLKKQGQRVAFIFPTLAI